MENQNKPSKPDSNMLWAILCTVVCCLPLGIVSIISASKVDGLYMSGDYEGAQEAADKAMKYAKIGAISGLAVGVLYIIFVALGVAASVK